MYGQSERNQPGGRYYLQTRQIDVGGTLLTNELRFGASQFHWTHNCAQE